METDTLTDYDRSIQVPKSEIGISNDQVLFNADEIPTERRENTGIKQSPNYILSATLSIGEDVNRITLSPKIDGGLSSSVPTSRASRGRSVLESTMLEESSPEKLICTADHSMSSILNHNINDFLKIIKTVSEVEESLTENELEIHPMQKFVAHTKKIVDARRSGQKSASKIKNTIQGFKEDLEDAVDIINYEPGKFTSFSQKAYNDKLQKIVNDGREKSEIFHDLKTRMTVAQKNASEAEIKRKEDALKGFSLKMGTPIFPKIAYQLDDIPFKRFNLISDPPANVGAEEPPLDKKIKTLMDTIKKIEINRTDSRIKKTWMINADINIMDFETHGILEMDAESIKTLNGALEIPKHVQNHSLLIYSPEELKVLERMNTRRTYLKNPRFSKYSTLPKIQTSSSSLIQLDSNIANNQDFGIFAEPGVILFTDYEVGKECTRKLRIRNKTKNSHRFRLEPASDNENSAFFTFLLIKSPIKNDGLVAPGMSCTYNIKFIPDSLTDVAFMLNVSTEMGQSFVVPIYAQRNAPLLTIPNSLHCGPCRAGFIAHRKWEFQNTGGPGKFMIIKGGENVDPYMMIKSIEADLTADEEVVFQDGPFEIFPAYFTMDTLEKKVLHVTYTAKEIDFSNEFEDIFEREDRIMVKIGCDNGQILEMPIVAIAQTCKLEISKFDPRKMPVSFEKHENEASRFILNFGKQNSYAVTSTMIVVKNKTRLKLPYKWVSYDNPGHFGEKIDYGSVIKSESVQVIPSKGWIYPEAETLFEINFSPEKVKDYDILTKLLICNDLQKYKKSTESTFEDQSLVIRCLGEGVEYDIDISPPLILLTSGLYAFEPFFTEIRIVNHSISKIAFEWFLENLDGTILDVELTQTSGTILANETILIGILIFAKLPIHLDGNLICVTGHGMGPKIIVPIKGDVQLRTSTICFDEDLVDFGLVALGNSSTKRINLVNTSNYSISWKVFGHNREKEINKKSEYHLECEPSSGTLAAKESREIEIQYVPTWHQSFHGLLECQISANSIPGQHHLTLQNVPSFFTASAIQMKAEVQSPQMHVLNPKNYVSCFIGVSFDWNIMLQNITMLDTRYRWKPVQISNVRVEFPNDGGELKGKETVEVTLKVTFLSLGDFPDISLLVDVDEMLYDQGQLRLQLDAKVYNIDVAFKVEARNGLHSVPFTTRTTLNGIESQVKHISTAGNQLKFDFGSDCPIFGTRLRSLIIRNMTSIRTSYKLWFEHYTATLDEEPINPVVAFASSFSTELQLLKSTPRSTLGFSSKSGKSYIDNINKVRNMVQEMQDLLKNGRGAAFNPTPKEGMLEPWAEIKIDIISYNNLVGTYEDMLHVEVGTSIHETMGVSLKVVGSSIKFTGAQLVSNKKNIAGWIDRINFGSRIINLNWKCSDGIRTQSAISQESKHRSTELFSKIINIENQSPRSVILNWKVYIQYSTCPDQIGPGENLNMIELVNDSNLVKENEIGIFEIVPHSMTIQAFKSMPLKVLFRSALVGTYNALAVAEVAYLESGGELRYAPVKPNTKLYYKSLARIHIQSKVIEPHLSLEDMEKIRIKRKLKVQKPDDPDDYKSVNAFLKNNSDAICLFKIETEPSDILTLKTPAPKYLQPISKTEQIFQLKPTEQMLITVSFNPRQTHYESSIKNKIKEERHETEITGQLKVLFSNGMIQTFHIEVSG